MTEQTLEQTAQQLNLPDYVPEVHPGRDVIMLVHSSGDGRKVFINGRDQKKWEVSGVYPFSEDRRFFSPDEPLKIGVSKHRGAEALVQAIQKRFLPQYHQDYAELLEQCKAYEKLLHEERDLRDRILKVLGREPSTHERRNSEFTLYRGGLDKVRVLRDKVKFETAYLPEDVAVEVIKLLQERCPDTD